MTQNSDMLAIKAVIDGVDHVAAEMENEWGVGRLRLLVDDDMRERFDRQAALFNEAVFTNDAKAVRRHGEGMRKAWRRSKGGARAEQGWRSNTPPYPLVLLLRSSACSSTSSAGIWAAQLRTERNYNLQLGEFDR